MRDKSKLGLILTIDINFIGTIASIASLILAIVFWHLANKQAQKADSILNEIKEKMLSWQSDINRAAVNLIQARPEVIAQQVSLEEAKSQAAFDAKIASIIETLASELDDSSAGYKIALLKELLEHRRQSVLGSEQIKANVVIQQQRKNDAVEQP